MKKIRQILDDWFKPEAQYGASVDDIVTILENPQARAIFARELLDGCYGANIEVDRALLGGQNYLLNDLCAKRQAFNRVLEIILSARRQVMQTQRHNPRPVEFIDMDRVTA